MLNNESTYVKLPKWLKKLKYVINPINDKKGNNKCFDYYSRINKIEPFLKYFDFENINYPLEKEDNETFEKNNESIALNFLKSDDENKKVSYLFKSNNNETRENKIYLLLLENKHHTYVSKPNILLKRLK